MSSAIPSTGAGRRDDREETENERNDRNWTEILQELRVIQTGTQILTGFLLTLPFQQRFSTLDAYQLEIYLALVVVAALATTLALSPVALHRALFHRRAKGTIVKIANVVLRTTLAAVGLTLAGTAMLIFDVVVSRQAGVIGGVIALAVLAVAWVAFPYTVRRRYPRA